MPRTRSIKPSFFMNEDLAELPCEARLLFIGLWTIADREGRLEDRPRKIKAAVFPYDEWDVDGLIGQLALKGFLRRYEATGGRYIHIVNFKKHQNPHPKEAPSDIPVLVEDERDSSEKLEKDFASREKDEASRKEGGPGHENDRTSHGNEIEGRQCDGTSREEVRPGREISASSNYRRGSDHERNEIIRDKPLLTKDIRKEKEEKEKEEEDLEQGIGGATAECDSDGPGRPPAIVSALIVRSGEPPGFEGGARLRTEEPGIDASMQRGQPAGIETGSSLGASGRRAIETASSVKAVFEYWREKTRHVDAKLTREREVKIRERLEEGYTTDQLRAAVDGCGASSFHQGDNERGHRYDDITLICRSGSKVEQFIEMTKEVGDERRQSGKRSNVKKIMEGLELIRSRIAQSGDSGDDNQQGESSMLAAGARAG
jgi:hypothetical protein